MADQSQVIAGQQDDVCDVDQLIDKTPISWRQMMVILLCALLCMADGFDVQAMAYAAPQIARDWNLAPSALAPAFSAGIFGGLIGGFFICPLADRIGPKRVLIISVLIFGPLTLATAFVTSTTAITILRGLSSIGMGSLLAPVIAYMVATAPRRMRSVAIVLTGCFITLGAILGGVVSSFMIVRFGWQSIFILGGVTPLVVLAVAAFVLHEPLSYLLLSRQPESRVRAALEALGKGRFIAGVRRFTFQQPPQQQRAGLAGMVETRLLGTVVLYVATFIAANFYFIIASWLPLTLSQAGFSVQTAVLGGVVLSSGGLIGCILSSFMMNRLGVYTVMAGGYGLAAALMLVPAAGASGGLLFVLIFLIGLTGFGAHFCLPVLMTSFYPRQFHNTAVGFSMGFARMGGAIAPFIGAWALQQGGAGMLYLVAAVGAIVPAALIWATGQRWSTTFQ